MRPGWPSQAAAEAAAACAAASLSECPESIHSLSTARLARSLALGPRSPQHQAVVVAGNSQVQAGRQARRQASLVIGLL